MTGTSAPASCRADIMAALEEVVDPCSIATGAPIGLVSMGLVKDVVLDRGACVVTLRTTSPLCMQAPMIMDAVERRLARLAGLTGVRCTIDHGVDWEPSMMAAAARDRLRAIRPMAVPG